MVISEPFKGFDKRIAKQIAAILFTNSREHISSISKTLGVSIYTINKYIEFFNTQMKFVYTVDIDPSKLGLSTNRLLFIKFEADPDFAYIKKILKRSMIVQNAYTCIGSFDLVINAVGESPNTFNKWQYNLRKQLHDLKPHVKTVSVDHIIEGGFPLRGSIISKSNLIGTEEKKILTILAENANTKLTELEQLTNIKKQVILLKINQMIKKKIINAFRAYIQEPDGYLKLIYAFELIPAKEHPKNMSKIFINTLCARSDPLKIATEYAVVCDTSGYYDGVDICNFYNNDSINRIGPIFFKSYWKIDEPRVEQAVLTGVLVGRWPFNTNSYNAWKSE